MKTNSRVKNTPLLNQMNMIKLTWAVCALILITGCVPHIHRIDPLKSDGQVIFVDAKQRGVITNAVKSKNGLSSALRICSEPPPDVFSAIAASFGANASADAVGLAASLSENAATIERTQTINILRESMYRTCERYMSDAISKNEFIVQAARDQRAMVAVLAIEQLTGVQKAASTALTTASSAVSGLSGDAITTLHKAREDHANLQAQANAKKKEAEDSKPMGACNGLNENTTDEDEKKKLALCKKAKDLQQKADQAKAHYDVLQKAMTQATVLATNSKGMLSSTGQINQMAAQMAASKHTAEKVVEIVENVGNFDEVQMTCVVLLRNLSNMTHDDRINIEEFQKKCLELIKVKAETEIEKEKVIVAKTETEIEEEKTKQEEEEIKQAMSCMELFHSLKGTSGEENFQKKCLDLIAAKTETKIEEEKAAVERAKARAAAEKEKAAMINERVESIQRLYDIQIDELWEKIKPKEEKATERFDMFIKEVDIEISQKFLNPIHKAINEKNKDDFSNRINLAMSRTKLFKLVDSLP